jgi:hypothetical protein
LNDEANFETAWALPYFLLPPGEYLIIYASGTSDATAAFHAPFKLKEEGENVVLFNTNGNILDISPAVAILPNYSIGPDIHEANRWLMFDNPTPGYANSTLNPVAAPLWWEDISIETPSGIYTFPLEVLHNNYDSALSIRYTINGTEPTAISPVWEGSLRITDMASSSSSIINIPTSDTWEIPQGDFAKGTILKSAAFRNGVRVSEIKENTYFNKATAEHTSSFFPMNRVSMYMATIHTETVTSPVKNGKEKELCLFLNRIKLFGQALPNTKSMVEALVLIHKNPFVFTPIIWMNR